MKNVEYLLLAFTVMLSGCGSSAPSCSDPVATNLVTQIVTEELEKTKQAFVQMNGANSAITYTVNIKNIRTADKNNDTGNFKCAATVDVTSNSFVFQGSHDITYTTEMTDDKKPYVTVYGFKI